MELISREDAIKCLDGNVLITEQKEAEAVKEYFEMVIARLKALPTIEERKEGSWIPVDSYSAYGGVEEIWEAQGNPIAFHYCSECKEQANANEFGEELLTDYCPYCGARMKGE